MLGHLSGIPGSGGRSFHGVVTRGRGVVVTRDSLSWDGTRCYSLPMALLAAADTLLRYSAVTAKGCEAVGSGVSGP